MRRLGFPSSREALLPPGLVVLLALGAFAGFHLTRPTTMTIAVAPNGGTEPVLLRAYAEELARRKLGIRLRISGFGGVGEGAEALKAGKADLAVLREFAAFVAAPGASSIRGISELGPL